MIQKNKKFRGSTLIWILCTVLLTIAGCTQSYLPWVAGPAWTLRSSEVCNTMPVSVEVSQRELENFCEDNRQSVEEYRRYLESDIPWATSPEVDQRRRHHTRQFIEQYDRECQ